MDSPAKDYDAARYQRAGRGKIYDSILDTIGDTPLVRLPRLSAELKPKGIVLAKLNAWSSQVGALKVTGDPQNPTVEMRLTGVDVESVIDREEPPRV